MPIRPLLSAKDFITNVSTTFPGAAAQVINGPTPKYTIRGIRPRAVPVDGRGRPYIRCMWQLAETGAECGAFAQSRVATWEHVLTTHVGVQRNAETGKFDNSMAEDLGTRLVCRWAGCGRFAKAGDEPSVYAFAMHLKTHLPNDDIGTVSKTSRSSRLSIERGGVPDGGRRPSSELRLFWNTQTDERNDAAGLPLASILVLRNLARLLPKVESTASLAEETEGGLVHQIFGPVKERLFFVMAHNLSLREYLVSLMGAIAAAGA